MPHDTMFRVFKLILVCFGLWLESMLVLSHPPYPHGEVFQVSYRQKERVEAWLDYRQHPSPATETTYRAELRLMHSHEDWKIYVGLGALVVLNGFGIYYFMSYGKHNTAA